jgi:L,D-peptidoglycan transpeptidase YkuD (ErfK/YbiS/YcfS/YnhG family)
MRATLTSSGTFSFGSETFRAAFGRGGIRRHKQEGDGATPVGLLPLRQVLYRPDRVAAPVSVVPVSVVPVGVVPVRPLGPDDGWCDDPADARYNRAVDLPISASAESLWRDDEVYDIIGVLGWNDDPVVPGRGSAIFLHLARPDFAPTQGCIALPLDDLRVILGQGLSEILVTG